MRKYLTPVFDFILTDDNQVKLLETGGGICGSGFPGYDYSHPETIRHLMLKGLAKKVEKLFLVNVADNALYKIFGESFLKELGNVVYFDSFSAFVMYARLNREIWQNSAVIFDRISPNVSFHENNYESLLEALDIHIPVVNAGAMKFFQNKVTFPLLFSEESASAIPKTHVITQGNHREQLEKINQDTTEKFIILPPASAHSRGVLMVDKRQLSLICDICFKGDKSAIDQLKFTSFEITVLQQLITMVNSQNNTFVIRELVTPKLVNCHGKNYRCVGRAVFCAVYDNENQIVDLQHLASFWQKAKEASNANELSNETLITYDTEIPGVNINTHHAAVHINAKQDQLLREMNSLPLDFSQEELAISLPILANAVEPIIKKICSKSLVDHFTFYTQSKLEPALQYYFSQRLQDLPVKSIPNSLYEWMEKHSPNYFLFIINQLYLNLAELAFLPHAGLFAPHLYKQMSKCIENHSASLTQYDTQLANISMIYAELNQAIKTNLNSFLQDKRYGKLFAFLKYTTERTKDEPSLQDNKVVSQKDLQVFSVLDSAFEMLDKRNFKQALESFQKFYGLAKLSGLNNEVRISYFENMALCHFSLGNYADAVVCYKPVIDHCKNSKDDQATKKKIMHHDKYTKCLEAWKNHEKALEAYKIPKYDSAIAFWESALKLFAQNLPGSEQVAICYSNLASCRRELKDFDLALKYCDQALGIYRALSIPEKDDRIQKIIAKQNQIEHLENESLHSSVGFTRKGNH